MSTAEHDMGRGEGVVVRWWPLGRAAVGTIDPRRRVASREIAPDLLMAMRGRLVAGEFLRRIDDAHGPNAAGGTLTLVIADALTSGRFLEPGAKMSDHAKKLFGWLNELYADNETARKAARLVIPRVCIDGRLPVGGTPDNSSVIGGHKDCGAAGSLKDILQYMASDMGNQALLSMAGLRGDEVDEAMHATIIGRASQLLTQGYVDDDSGPVLEAIIKGAGGAVPALVGDHQEVAYDCNTNSGLTLDSEALAKEYPGLRAFNVDAGTFGAAAQILTEQDQDSEAARQATLAMQYFNDATVLVLGGPSLYVVNPSQPGR